ncbi:helix-turn-helix transcriptional regulator [Ensifer sp. 2YAB10]|jgi:transcriptional regulator with XRE-family HTH domain|uniref:helix-turn-helix domain-containing protein n=1 Tax=Ensifer TaxID=106591 RepID=UPI000DE33C0D|nr:MULTISPECIES: helix-turn-helix transcriptional regulator [Ensifer]MBK5566836.1 helix-turn-helix transcriptional regulator [Ensifer sp. SSB1]MBZ7923764.1 helix-turn-helix domain-containing protein [Ensifer adhaerens]UAX92308.1 helix-turn-helix domain-containing protein [Ensifer adhaerens]UAX99940.1 helix-turn-helix domain-containing protein [Ensifer adhaerens]UAY07324.1 helix-turn-helix domain-containing protein [Ensifer adhaerens]
MTPFGEALRELRRRKGVSQKQMAAAINVSAAYLSALEHGKRGAPSFDFLQRVAGYFNVIWDEAEELFRIANVSAPKVVLDTSGLTPEHTAFANRLSEQIRALSPETIRKLEDVLEKATFPDNDRG